VVADVERGFAVHHRAEHPVLRPGEQYFYRFYTCDENSPVGRFRTARPADSQETVRIGFFSCQAYEAGFYTAHTGLAAERDLDIVVCLGDYIYEQPFYEGPAHRHARRQQGRRGADLGEYRDKYALYHSDPRLLELRRQFPMIAIWDDHEVEDNYARDLPGNETKQVRVPVPGPRPTATARSSSTCRASRARGARPDLRHHLARRARRPVPARPAPVPRRPAVRGTASSPRAPSPRSRGAPTSAGQKEWLKRGLQGSRATWKVVANQAMIMSLDGPPRNEINKDQWDGYAPSARRSSTTSPRRHQGRHVHHRATSTRSSPATSPRPGARAPERSRPRPPRSSSAAR
jgi:alkaline phosphatase D